MPHIICGPTGAVSRGHVLDVNPRAFTEALKEIDPLLYVKWNPKQVKGWGCWEIRRAPELKTAVYQGTHNGVSFVELKPIEFNTVNLILRCEFLNYDALRKLKEMDTWSYGGRGQGWLDAFEKGNAAAKEQQLAKADEELKYNLRQEKRATKDLYELVASGINPAQALAPITKGS